MAIVTFNPAALCPSTGRLEAAGCVTRAAGWSLMDSGGVFIFRERLFSAAKPALEAHSRQISAGRSLVLGCLLPRFLLTSSIRWESIEK
jgi:hypothetical protein